MGAERQFTFTVPEGYQLVYRKILDQERKCWQTGLITAAIVVQGDLFTDIKQGTITTALHGGFGVDTHRVIDVLGMDNGSTRVTGMFALGPVEKYGRILKEWVVDNSKDCNLKL